MLGGRSKGVRHGQVGTVATEDIPSSERITVTLYVPPPSGTPRDLSHGVRRVTSWRSLFDSFRTVAERPPSPTDKALLPAWSPATFRGDHRTIKACEALLACVLDYDNEIAPKRGSKAPLPEDKRTTQDAALALWTGTRAISYSSPSNTSDLPKHRLVLPYSRAVTPSEHERVRLYVWRRCQDAGHVLDASCKDPSRLWYFGARRNDSYRAIWQDGSPLDVDTILALEDTASDVTPDDGTPVEWEAVQDVTTIPVDKRIELARRRLLAMPAAVSGNGGHIVTIKAANVVVRGYSLPGDVALDLMREYNERCSPPWSENELRHKLEDAARYTQSPLGWCLRKG